MNTNSVYYLIISPNQSQPLDVVDKCLIHFSELFKREPRYNEYDILNMFFLNGVCAYLEGNEFDLSIVHKHLEANEITSFILEKNEFHNELLKAKEKFDNNQKLKVVFGDQEFDAHPSIEDVAIIDTDEYNNYLVKTFAE